MTRFGAIALLAVAVGSSASAARAAERAGVFTFTVTREGEPIGTHRVAFSHDGARTEIDAEMELKVTFAMVPLYHFSNERREVWQDGRPMMITSRTNDNGEQLDITLRPDGAGYVRTVNGRVDRLDVSTRVLAMWNPEMLDAKPGLFVSVIENQTLEVAFSFLGQETMVIDGREIVVDHYRMTGTEERDIWYDADGQVARVRLERHGDQIEYVRNEYLARPLDGRLARN
ncbi:MAG TPA: DUF6134 family protein [Thermohalobaculum sp.]|nr:DUF6134 family protein [Thermohalobaculum sp.]